MKLLFVVMNTSVDCGNTERHSCLNSSWFHFQKKRKYTKSNKSEPPNLHKRLSALSCEQLTKLIENLVGNHPELEEVILSFSAPFLLV